MNNLGVAIASDSAVSSGGRVRNTSEKIHELGGVHKVAVLASGRADFIGIPWEVIVSAWCETLDKQLPHLFDYKESLYKFLRTLLPVSQSFTDQESAYLASIADSHIGPTEVTSYLFDRIKEEILKNNTNNEIEIDQLNVHSSEWTEEFKSVVLDTVLVTIRDEIDYIFTDAITQRSEKYQQVDNVTARQTLDWAERYIDSLSTSPSEWLFNEKLEWFDNLYKQLLSICLLHADYYGESSIVIVGYGSSQLFPSLARFWPHGLVNGTLIKRFERLVNPEGSDFSEICGQSDAIRYLVYGTDSLLTQTAAQVQSETLSRLYHEVEALEREDLTPLKELVMQTMQSETIVQEMNKAGSDQRFQPFVRIINLSPIKDLAEFAAQLVGIQAVYAAMQQDNPTVGGYIDVASITHRDGFQWLRHKSSPPN
ncbi:MAG: hypothetical protein ACO3BI_02850 [Candidatus Nanopelagicales bacterium]